MRLKTLLFIIAIGLMAAFVVLNVDEFTRTSTLNLGITTMQLPLGLTMLGLLVIGLLVFLATALVMRSSNLLETRKFSKELTAQRELADKAEASRFTELQAYLASQAVLSATQTAEAKTAAEQRMTQMERTLLERLEQIDNTNAAYWGQHDDALARNRLQPQP